MSGERVGPAAAREQRVEKVPAGAVLLVEYCTAQRLEVHHVLSDQRHVAPVHVHKQPLQRRAYTRRRNSRVREERETT